MRAGAQQEPCLVLGNNGMLHDRPGFDIEMIGSRTALRQDAIDQRQVLIVSHGHWRLEQGGERYWLNPGDSCLLPQSQEYLLCPAMSGDASIFRVTATQDPAGLSQIFDGVNT